MKYTLLLNAKGGTVKKMGPQVIEEQFVSAFEGMGHEARVHRFESGDLIKAIEDCAASSTDAIIMCGGDGSMSAAASVLANKDVAFGVLPGGTMNLYARTLGMPLEIGAAINALAHAETRKADVGRANGRIFIHQFATGFQTKTVRLRDQMEYGSKFFKMLASTKAILSVAANPPIYSLKVSIDGGKLTPVKTSLVAVTNNVFPLVHMPYADEIDGGVLGFVRTQPFTRTTAMRILRQSIFGTEQNNEFLTTARATKVTLQFPKLRKRDQAVVDGELIPLEKTVEIEIVPKALNVLVPRR